MTSVMPTQVTMCIVQPFDYFHTLGLLSCALVQLSVPTT